MRGFPLERVVAGVGDLVAVSPESGCRRLARLCDPIRPALVLGSAQRDELIDRVAVARAGLEVVRRRSGGGALLVAPQRQVWLDVLVPASDPLARDDIAAAAFWLGELWRDCLADLGIASGALSVHRAGTSGVLGKTVCFAGLGPGEVHARGAKIVGVSQRRNRHGTWLHSMALLGGDAAEVVSYLDTSRLAPGLRADLVAQLRHGVEVLDPVLAEPLASCLGSRLASFEG